MEYHYKIKDINQKDHWIFIYGDEYDIEDTDSFIYLVKKIQKGVNGKIKNVGDFQYKIVGDNLNLIYQWDSLFGIVVIYPHNISANNAVNFLKKYF